MYVPEVVRPHLRTRRRAGLWLRSAEHEIGQAQAGRLTGECGVASGGRVRLRIVLGVDVIGADAELMIPAKDAQVVRDLVHPRRRGRRQTGGHLEAARHVHAEEVGQDRRGLDAEIGVVDRRHVYGVTPLFTVTRNPLTVLLLSRSV